VHRNIEGWDSVRRIVLGCRKSEVHAVTAGADRGNESAEEAAPHDGHLGSCIRFERIHRKGEPDRCTVIEQGTIFGRGNELEEVVVDARQRAPC